MAIVLKLRRAGRRAAARIGSLAAARRAHAALAQRPPAAPSTPFALYFADSPVGYYQLGQWLAPLAALARDAAPVALIVRDARTALRAAGETALPIVLAAGSADVEEFVRRHGVQVLFYVNNNQANFTTLRINGPAHVHLSHGESEKTSMASNQLKAYDFAFVAGQAAVDRITDNVPRLDASHLKAIGRPQLDQVRRTRPEGDRVTVLYAPTWEGDGKDMAYSSLASHGSALVAALLADPRFRLIYRPHPKTGSAEAHFASLDRSLARSIDAASGDGHRVDRSPNPWEALGEADVVVADVSAMAVDAVGLDLPLVVCGGEARPVAGHGSGSGGAPPRLVESATHWDRGVPASAADDLAALANNPVGARQHAYRSYVFGDTEASGLTRFIAASAGLLGAHGQAGAAASS